MFTRDWKRLSVDPPSLSIYLACSIVSNVDEAERCLHGEVGLTLDTLFPVVLYHDVCQLCKHQPPLLPMPTFALKPPPWATPYPDMPYTICTAKVPLCALFLSACI